MRGQTSIKPICFANAIIMLSRLVLRHPAGVRVDQWWGGVWRECLLRSGTPADICRSRFSMPYYERFERLFANAYVASRPSLIKGNSPKEEKEVAFGYSTYASSQRSLSNHLPTDLESKSCLVANVKHWRLLCALRICGYF